MNDPTDLRAAELNEQDEAKLAQKLKDQELSDFRHQMSTPVGRRVIWGLLGRVGMFRSSFTSNRSMTDFNEGQRNVGLYYMGLINEHCLAEYVLMLKEHAENAT